MAENNSEIKNENLEGEEEGALILTLVDEETGKELSYEVIDEWQDGDKLYYAVVSADEEDAENYEIFRVNEDEDGITLDTVDDDEEWDRVAEYFDDKFFSEVDYDAEENAEK